MAMTFSPDAIAARALQVVASGRDAAALLSALHDLARDAARAQVSVILELDRDGAGYHVRSAAGLETSPLDLWFTSREGADLAARAASATRPLSVLSLRSAVPELADRLKTSCAVVAALTTGAASGLLVLGCEPDSASDPGFAAALASAFTLAMERARQQRDADVERDLRQVMLAFTGGGESPAASATALAQFCRNVARLLGADAAEIWQHDRRARELVLSGASDGTPPGRLRLAAADEESPAGAGLRQRRPTFIGSPDGSATGLAPVLTIPLRGRRRALGALVLHGVRVESAGEADLLARAEQAGRQLSGVLENVQLLDDVLQSRRQLENVFDSLTDLVVVCDHGGRILEANRAFAERVGRPPQALLGCNLATLVGPDLAHLAAAGRPVPDGGAGEGREGDAAEVVDARLNGTFVATSVPLVGIAPEPVGRVLLAREVTEARRLESERAALERRLAQTDKLQALGQFVAGIAHELNNPLQAVLGHLELMRAGAGLAPDLRRDLRLVYREAERAARIVKNLLVFAGSWRLRVRPLSVNALVTRVVRLRARAHRSASVEVIRHLDADLPRVRADGTLLQQALLNIVLNAEQAMGGAGRLTVRSQVHAEGQVRVTVEDTGPGLTAAVRSRLFEPFFTTKEVGAGTGLGLAIAFGIVRAHGGTLEADNHPGGGARFVVTLPVTPPPEAPGPRSTTPVHHD
jgi:PAS domain S-box-containing protein